MSELETHEDFVRIYKALHNTRSKPHQYAVRTFGYCKVFCKEITEYTGNYGPEWCSETCLKCGHIFGNGGCAKESYATDVNKMPQVLRKQINYMRSRKQQRIFFAEVLKEYLKKQKIYAKQLRKNARAIANHIKSLTDFCKN